MILSDREISCSHLRVIFCVEPLPGSCLNDFVRCLGLQPRVFEKKRFCVRSLGRPGFRQGLP